MSSRLASSCFDAVRLHEAAEFGVVTAPANVGVDGGGDLSPAIERAVEVELLGALDRAVEGHPRHDLRIGEVLALIAHFPDAFVRLDPDALEMGEKCLLQAPAGLARGDARASRLMERIHHLAEHVEL